MSLKEQAEILARNAMTRLRGRHGARQQISRVCGIAWQSPDHWIVVPLDRVFAVARIFNMQPEQLRPDHFLDDPLRAERAARFIASHGGDALMDKPKRKPFTERHRAIWNDMSLVNDQAAALVSDDIGRKISVRSLQIAFGPSGRASGYHGPVLARHVRKRRPAGMKPNYQSEIESRLAAISTGNGSAPRKEPPVQ